MLVLCLHVFACKRMYCAMNMDYVYRVMFTPEAMPHPVRKLYIHTGYEQFSPPPAVFFVAEP